jgi:hypothetical protein
MRQRWLLTLSLLFVCVLVWRQAATESVAEQGNSGHVQHVVIGWLNEPGNAEARQKVIEASYGFAEIPGVLSVSAGPSLSSERAIVDSSYDVGVVITLKDAAALAAYLEHPKHKHALKEVLQSLIQKMIVYDFIVPQAE